MSYRNLAESFGAAPFSVLISELHFFQTHQETLKKLVDLIDITSIMEVGSKS